MAWPLTKMPASNAVEAAIHPDLQLLDVLRVHPRFQFIDRDRAAAAILLEDFEQNARPPQPPALHFSIAAIDRLVRHGVPPLMTRATSVRARSQAQRCCLNHALRADAGRTHRDKKRIVSLIAAAAPLPFAANHAIHTRVLLATWAPSNYSVRIVSHHRADRFQDR